MPSFLTSQQAWAFPHIRGSDYQVAKHAGGRIDIYTASYMRWESKQHVQAWLESFDRQEALRPIFLDTETTGTRSFSEIIEICLVNEHGKTLFRSLVYPTTEIEPMATMVHGLTRDDVIGAPRFPQIYETVMNHLRDHVIIAYNAAFDMRLLKQTADCYELAFPELHTACLMYAYAKYRDEYIESGNGRLRCKTCRLDEALVYEQLDMPPFHRAERDAQCLHRLFQAMGAKI
jgi:DNA polymerase III epsilon subunit-like protein